MACNVCAPTDNSCVTVSSVLSPCACADTPAIREEGPPGAEGPVGDTPEFTVGTVTEGAAGVTFTTNTPTDITVDFVIPQPPIDTANTWTAVQTYEQQAIFELGLETTGGTSTFGGSAFTVTPDAEFSGDVTVAGDEFVSGTLRIGGNTVIDGNASVAGSTFLLGGVQIDGQVTFGVVANFVVEDSDAGSFPRGYLVLDSCNHPVLVPNRGGDLYQKEDATSLVTIAAAGSGSISDAFVVAVPVSGCLPQVTPIVTVTARVAYAFDNVPTGLLTLRLWKTAVTSGTQLDSMPIGIVATTNAASGCIMLEGQTTLQQGNTNFYVEAVNGTGDNFVPTQITFWAVNT